MKVVGQLVAGLGLSIVAQQAGLPGLASAQGQVVSAGRSFACTPVAVWDGDGPLWCAEGLRIRLAGIAARETDGTCRSNQPCPTSAADAARDALVRLVVDKSAIMPCYVTGHGSGSGGLKAQLRSGRRVTLSYEIASSCHQQWLVVGVVFVQRRLWE